VLTHWPSGDGDVTGS